MTQRMIAACVAVPLLLALIAVAVFVPVPFASYHPGPTFDVLGETDGRGDHPGQRRRRPTATTARSG